MMVAVCRWTSTPEEGVPAIELDFASCTPAVNFPARITSSPAVCTGWDPVVNALSTRVEVTVKREGQVYEMAFENGDKASELAITGTCGRRTTGTRVRFWPDASYFDSPKFSVSRLVHLLKAKAVLCPGLTISFEDKQSGERLEWCYEDGLRDYLIDTVKESPRLPEQPFTGSLSTDNSAVDWAPLLAAGRGRELAESYVNLIPTIQGGTHVNGLRQGLLDAMREFP